jgi:hypothetical protein
MRRARVADRYFHLYDDTTVDRILRSVNDAVQRDPGASLVNLCVHPWNSGTGLLWWAIMKTENASLSLHSDFIKPAPEGSTRDK